MRLFYRKYPSVGRCRSMARWALFLPESVALEEFPLKRFHSLSPSTERRPLSKHSFSLVPRMITSYSSSIFCCSFPAGNRKRHGENQADNGRDEELQKSDAVHVRRIENAGEPLLVGYDLRAAGEEIMISFLTAGV